MRQFTTLLSVTDCRSDALRGCSGSTGRRCVTARSARMTLRNVRVGNLLAMAPSASSRRLSPHRSQEQALGGLDPTAMRLFDGLAHGDKRGAERRQAPQCRHGARARISGRAPHRHRCGGRLPLARQPPTPSTISTSNSIRWMPNGRPAKRTSRARPMKAGASFPTRHDDGAPAGHSEAGWSAWGSAALGTSFADQRRLIGVFIASWKYYAAEVAIAIGSTIEGCVEIGSVTSPACQSEAAMIARSYHQRAIF